MHFGSTVVYWMWPRQPLISEEGLLVFVVFWSLLIPNKVTSDPQQHQARGKQQFSEDSFWGHVSSCCTVGISQVCYMHEFKSDRKSQFQRQSHVWVIKRLQCNESNQYIVFSFSNQAWGFIPQNAVWWTKAGPCDKTLHRGWWAAVLHINQGHILRKWTYMKIGGSLDRY